MTSTMVIRDMLWGTGIMAFATFVLTMVGEDACLPGGVGVGFYLAAVWIAGRYE